MEAAWRHCKVLQLMRGQPEWVNKAALAGNPVSRKNAPVVDDGLE